MHLCFHAVVLTAFFGGGEGEEVAGLLATGPTAANMEPALILTGHRKVQTLGIYLLAHQVTAVMSQRE